MNGFAVVDWNMTAMVAIVTFAIVAFLILPLVTILNWCNRNAPGHESAPEWSVTRAGYVYHAVTVLILLGGILLKAFGSNTWLGDLFDAVGGLWTLVFILFVLSYSVGWGLRRLGIELHEIYVPAWDDTHPVKAWSPAQEVRDLKASPVFAIEFQNDKKTRSDFILSMFCHCFGMSRQDAYRELMAIRNEGSSVIGSMSQANAEALIEYIRTEAARRGFPLQCKVVPASWELGNE